MSIQGGLRLGKVEHFCGSQGRPLPSICSWLQYDGQGWGCDVGGSTLMYPVFMDSSIFTGGFLQ